MLNASENYGWLDHRAEKEAPLLPAASSSVHLNLENNPFSLVSTVFDKLLSARPIQSSSSSNNNNDIKAKSSRPILPLLPTAASEDNNRNCQYEIEAPLGFGIRFGMESKPKFISVTDETFGVVSHRSYDVAFGLSSGGSKTADGVIEVTGNKVFIDTQLSPGERMRINFQIIEP